MFNPYEKLVEVAIRTSLTAFSAGCVIASFAILNNPFFRMGKTATKK